MAGLSDLVSLIGAVQNARGRETTVSQNVSPEQTQALINQMLSGNNGIAQIVASHRSSGMRSSSGSQAAVENLMAKAAAQAALASSSQTTKQSGLFQGNEARLLGLAGAATPFLKPYVEPVYNQALQSSKDFAASLFGEGSGSVNPAPVSDAFSNAMSAYGTLGATAQDEAAKKALQEASGLMGDFQPVEYIPNTLTEVADTATSWGNNLANAAEAAWGTFTAANGGMIVDKGAPTTRRVARTQSVGDVSAGVSASAPAINSARANNSLDSVAQAAMNQIAQEQGGKLALNFMNFMNPLAAALNIGRMTNNLNQAFNQLAEGTLAVQQGKNKQAQQAQAMDAYGTLGQTPNNPVIAMMNQIAAMNAFGSLGSTGGEGDGGNSAIGAVGGFGAADSGASGTGGTSTAACGGQVKKAHAAIGGEVVGDKTPKGVDGVGVALDGGEYVIPAHVVDGVGGPEVFDKLLSVFGYGKRRVSGVPL